MYYGQIFNCDVANGPGMRVSLFVSGCRNHCEGCFQPETWDFRYGKPYTRETEKRIFEMLRPSYIRGLTILGGDPLEPENVPDVWKLVLSVRESYGTTKDIWLYTGYRYEDKIGDDDWRTGAILDLVDVVVDGPFVQELKDITLRFRGSSNQRLIDVRETKRNGLGWRFPVMVRSEDR